MIVWQVWLDERRGCGGKWEGGGGRRGRGRRGMAIVKCLQFLIPNRKA